jgi:hypothetical protein
MIQFSTTLFVFITVVTTLIALQVIILVAKGDKYANKNAHWWVASCGMSWTILWILTHYYN